MYETRYVLGSGGSMMSKRDLALSCGGHSKAHQGQGARMVSAIYGAFHRSSSSTHACC